MKRVLLVGEHPQGMSGNSHMMKAVINQLDKEKYQAVCVAETPSSIVYDSFFPSVCPVIVPNDPSDLYACRKIAEVVSASQFDALLMVGVDLWHYFSIWNELVNLRNNRTFKWSAIFPYDLISIREDWLQLINSLDLPGVYSQHGYDLLAPHVPSIHYFRPPMLNHHLYRPFSEKEKKQAKEKHLSGHDKGRFVFGFVGNNQVRKDPQRMLRAYFDFKKDHPDCVLYMHTNLQSGVFNLGQYIEDCGAVQGDVLIKNQQVVYSDQAMAEVYNAMDCLVNTSLQEGLSWTILQAQLCKTKVIAADNTAQSELLREGALEYSFPIKCTDLAYVPILAGNGPTHVETRACNQESILRGMELALEDVVWTPSLDKAYEKAKEWVDDPSDVNILLGDLFVTSYTSPTILKEKVLFIQYSSAGDVFMTTRCFKGLKKRHGDMPLVYMTQPQYRNIIEGNPYIDEIIDWDLNKAKQYQYVYNPHADRIAPGHWGRNCNSILSDFYWKILNVEPDDFFIKLTEPKFYHYADLEKKIKDYEYLFDQYVSFSNGDITKPILVVHTTGGNPHFRTYKYMKDVCQAMDDKYLTVQLGGPSDYPAWAKIDLRGKLSFQETAWVMSKAKMAVTVDSFVSHLSGAFGVSQVCLFGSGNYVVVQPLQVSGKLICMAPDYVKHCKGLGPCSGCITDCPVPCTSRHDPKDIIRNLQVLEAWIKWRDIEKEPYNPFGLGDK
jgi:ADP-heptose:LPS heptosyltransferase/glycosyltransferase involved in cell wall biosynthesis